MALDPSAVLNAAPPAKSFDILGSITRADQFNALQQKRQDDEGARRRAEMITKVVQEHAEDPDEAIAALRGLDWQAAQELEKSVNAQRKAVEERRTIELGNDLKEAELFSRLMGDGSESSWQMTGRYASTQAPEMASFFQQPYSPDVAKQVRDWGLRAEQRLKAEREAIESLEPTKWAPWFATAGDDEDWQDVRQSARFLLGRNADQVLRLLPETYSPEAVGKAKALAIGPEKVETLKGAEEGREIQRAGQAVTMRGQDLTAQTAAAGRAVALRGQDLVNARAKEAQAQSGATSGGTGGAKLSVGAVEKIAGVDQSLAMLDDIERLLPSMKRNIGVLDGRVAQARLATGVRVNEDLAEFAAQITGLKNATIKALTGAAMSEPEAQRIMQQIPDLSNPEPVFAARLKTTRRNLELLKTRTIELSGGTVAPQPARTPAESGGQKVGRFQVTVE